MANRDNMVFETDRLIVRLATTDDVGLFFDLWTNPDVMVNVGFPNGLPISRDDVRKQIESEGNSEFDRLLVIVLKETGQCVGECRMRRPDGSGVAGTDVKLLPGFWGHRYGVETKRALVSHLFTHTDCDAVEASPNVANIASIRMQEAVGAVRVGEAVYEFPEAMRDYTTPVHHYTYRIDRRHWKA